MTKTVTLLDEHDLDLEELCPECSAGSRNPLLQAVRDQLKPCTTCGGRRWVPTDLGQRVLELVQRYLLEKVGATKE